MRMTPTDVVYNFWGITVVISTTTRWDNLWEATATVQMNDGFDDEITRPISTHIGATMQEAITNAQRSLLMEMESAWLKNSQTFVY